ncbi:MAG: choice-of-anchor V domain-containing protein [Bacteroidota bacterium]
MKKNYILTLTLGLSIAIVSWQKSGTVETNKYKKSHRYNSGATAGKTGAPGESNCTECHSGSVQAGTTENMLIVADGSGQVTSYVPGETYTVALAMTSNPSKKGMQATVLTASNQAAGTFATVPGGGVAIISGSGKFYANHTSSSTTSAFPSWTWTWTAPATNVGPVRFYVATNKANNNGQNSGDIIYLSNHPLNATVGIEENKIETVSNFNASFSPENSTVYIQFSSLINGNNHVNIVDMNGRSVLNMNMGTSQIGINKDMIRLPEHVKNGMYVVQYFVDNNPMTKSIVVER